MKKILNPLFYGTAFYSFAALPFFAQKTVGACNAGVAIVGIGLFLLIAAVLLFFCNQKWWKNIGKNFKHPFITNLGFLGSCRIN